jgi:hypothetical protein
MNDGTYWDNVNASGVAQALLAEYPGFDQTQTRFDQYTSDHFHGPNNWQCGLVQSNCGSGFDCNTVDTTAGYAILESYAGLHMVSWTV